MRPISFPGPRYVNPRARQLVVEGEGDHDHALDLAEDSSPNYLRWISDLCQPWLGETVLEIGSGIGTVSQYLQKGHPRYLATDLSPFCLDALHQRFAGNQNVSVAALDVRTIAEDGERFDSAIMINVLEHIADDVGALTALREHLKPTGNVVIYVPAIDRLYGSWDLKVGHYRRYDKRHLDRVMRAAGLIPEELRFVNALAIPAWIVFSTLGSGSSDSVGRNLNLWDKTAVPLTRAIESRLRSPIGLNLLCSARRMP